MRKALAIVWVICAAAGYVGSQLLHTQDQEQITQHPKKIIGNERVVAIEKDSLQHE